MYETRLQDRDLRNLPQEVVNIKQTASRRLHMSTMRSVDGEEEGRKGSRVDRFADSVLDKLYRIELHKDDICFLMLVTVVSFFGWQVLKSWMF